MVRDLTQSNSCLALNTATLGHMLAGKGAGLSPLQVIDICSRKGIRGITFWVREFSSLKEAKDTANHAKSSNIDIIGLCRTPYLVGSQAPKTDTLLYQELMKTIELASALDAEVVTIVVGGIEKKLGSIQNNLTRITDVVGQFAEEAKKAGTKLALEPLHPIYCSNRSCLSTIRDAITIVEHINHPCVGLAVDIYHVWWDTSLETELSRIKGKNKIFGFHLCDWLMDTRDILFDRGMMGDGVAEIRRIRELVEATGYEGFCEVEIFSELNWWKKTPEEVLDEMIDRFRTVC